MAIFKSGKRQSKKRPKAGQQLHLLGKHSLSYGGELLKTRNGRSQARPLDTKNTIHLVLRSSKAKGEWSFRARPNQKKISDIVGKFSQKYAVQILSMANVGNHIHFQIKLFKRQSYKPFIRAITSAIAMAVTGVNRWSKEGNKGLKFWDYRPFTRVVRGYKALLTLKDYILINKLEGYGVRRGQARFILQGEGSLFAESFAQGPP